MFTKAPSTNEKIPKKGYTSNYTENDRKNGQVLDFVFFIGKDNPGETAHAKLYKKIKADCEAKNLKYVILGDGVTGVNLNDIKNLPNANNAVIYGHGNVRNGRHIISLMNKVSDSLDIVKAIQERIKCKNIIYCSCFGGKIIDDMKNSNNKNELQEGTFFAAYSAPDDMSLAIDTVSIIDIVINATKTGAMAPMFHCNRDIIKTITQTMVFAYQLKDELVSQTLLRKNREIYLEVEKFCEYQLSEFNKFIDSLLMNKNNESLLKELKNQFPNVNFEDREKNITAEKIPLLQLWMTKQQIEAFQQRSLDNHCVHNDTKVVSALLDKIPFEPRLLPLVILSNKSGMLDDMIKTLLEKNATHGQTVNAFKSDDVDSDVDIYSYSPLTFSIEYAKNTTSVRSLLQLGADIHLPDKEGRIPAEMLSKVNLAWAKLPPKFNLSYANLAEANLSHADLTYVDLTQSDLTDANLTRADLSGANLTRANLTGADLTGAELTGADLTGTDLTNVIGLTCSQLISAKSLINVSINAEQLKAMSNDEQKRIKEKLENDYKAYILAKTIKDENIHDVVLMIATIINDEEHPLKFNRLGASDYSNTTTYKAVVNFGIEKLATLLTPEKFNALDKETKKGLKWLAEQDMDTSIFDSFTMFNQSSAVSPPKKLQAVIKGIESPKDKQPIIKPSRSH
jgi:hypothetical protein